MFLIDGFSDPYRCCIAEKTGRRFDIGGCGGLAANNVECRNQLEFRFWQPDPGHGLRQSLIGRYSPGADYLTDHGGLAFGELESGFG